MKPYTVTSPTNSLAVTIYALVAFIGFGATLHIVKETILGQMMFNESWSVLTFIAGSAAVYATLSAPNRRDPDDSLAIELWASATLCILLGYFAVFLLFFFRSESGAFAATSFGYTMIFFIGFLARAIQIFVERRNLKKYREASPSG